MFWFVIELLLLVIVCFFKAILNFLVFLETNRLEILDYVPRDLTILYLEIVDSINNK